MYDFYIFNTGAHPKIEMDIRNFLRRVFVDPSASIQERAFWLTRILKQWPMVHQARIIYTLFGPTLGSNNLYIKYFSKSICITLVIKMYLQNVFCCFKDVCWQG